MKREKHLGLRVDAETYSKLKFIAKYEGRSLSGQVIYLAAQCVRAFEKEHGAISSEDLAALQDDQ